MFNIYLTLSMNIEELIQYTLCTMYLLIDKVFKCSKKVNLNVIARPLNISCGL